LIPGQLKKRARCLGHRALFACWQSNSLAELFRLQHPYHHRAQPPHFLVTGAGAALTSARCERSDHASHITGGFTGINHTRGHLLRDGASWPAPTTIHQTQVLIAGGGVAGLAAARAVRLKGIDDYALLELENSAGGNSRGGSVAGIPCPLDHSSEKQAASPRAICAVSYYFHSILRSKWPDGPASALVPELLLPGRLRYGASACTPEVVWKWMPSTPPPKLWSAGRPSGSSGTSTHY
jgi:hypothetical protein